MIGPYEIDVTPITTYHFSKIVKKKCIPSMAKKIDY